MSIYIYIYLYIFRYILRKRTERSRVLLQKNVTFSRSFLFLAKECCVLCVLFPFFRKERKRTEKNVLLGLISRQKLDKRTEKNGTFFFENGKECNVPNGKELSAQPCSWAPFIPLLT